MNKLNRIRKLQQILKCPYINDIFPTHVNAKMTLLSKSLFLDFFVNQYVTITFAQFTDDVDQVGHLDEGIDYCTDTNGQDFLLF